MGGRSVVLGVVYRVSRNTKEQDENKNRRTGNNKNKNKKKKKKQKEKTSADIATPFILIITTSSTPNEPCIHSAPEGLRTFLVPFCPF